MGEVVPLRFRVLLGRAGLRVDHVERILAEDHEEVLRSTDPDLASWLDGNAPGWGIEHEPVGYAQRALPIGADDFGTFIDHDKYLTFPTRADADACERHIRERAEAFERTRAARSLIDPDVAERCPTCRGPMRASTTRIDFRCGPVTFISEIPCEECPGCEETTIRLSDYGFTDVAQDEMRRWMDDDAMREARRLPVLEEINVPAGTDQGAMRALVTPVMERWIAQRGTSSARPSRPVPEKENPGEYA